MKKIDQFDKQMKEFFKNNSVDGICTIKILEISRQLKCSYSRVYNSLQRLIDDNFIKAEQANGVHGSPYVFTILQGE